MTIVLVSLTSQTVPSHHTEGPELPCTPTWWEGSTITVLTTIPSSCPSGHWSLPRGLGEMWGHGMKWEGGHGGDKTTVPPPYTLASRTSPEVEQPASLYCGLVLSLVFPRGTTEPSGGLGLREYSILGKPDVTGKLSLLVSL